MLGDYGAGPNHVLPTGGTARAQTWLRIDGPTGLAEDAAALARIEWLEAHARAADRRGPA